MMLYAKSIAAVLGAALMALIAALADEQINNVEWINVAIAGVNAASVFAAPNVKGAMFTKTILAVLSAVLVFLVSAISGGISSSEWLQIMVIAMSAGGIFLVPNKTAEARSATI